MTRLRDHVLASTAALLLLEAIQIVLETAAAALVFRGLILPPYGFFPTQIYDFVAKIRWSLAGPLGWLPELPAEFRAPSFADHCALIAQLLPACIATALVLGVAAGVAGAIVTLRRKARPSVIGYLWLWACVGAVVHVAAAVPPLSLEDSPTLHHLAYRARSFVVDGTVVAVAVFVASVALARFAAPLLARSRALAVSLGCVLLVAAAAGLLAAGSEEAKSAETAPVAQKAARLPDVNVVLISLDSLRADHVGCYGYGRATTPAIDKLASEGVRFANAVSTTSWTLPAHLTMFTSRYQLSHGVVHDTYVLSPDVPTLAEAMKHAGYVTAGFVSAPYLAAHYGYARGMDTYEDVSAKYGHRAEARTAVVSQDLVDLVLPWLDAHARDPFFLFVHDFDIHYDYVPPPPYDKLFDPDYHGKVDAKNFLERPDINRHMDKRDLDHVLALYDGEIRFTDDHVARILKKIDDLGLRSRTIVILLSDHGDEFFEHGNKGHHRTVYDEVLRVPFVVRLPDGARAGAVVDDEVSLVDVMPTILDLTGAGEPPGMEGVSLQSLLHGGTLARKAVFAEFYDKRGFNLQVARRTRESKVIQHFNRIAHPSRPAVELYDLAKDPGEKRDVAAKDPAAVRSDLDDTATWLNERWRVNRELQRAGGGANRTKIDADTMERLKSLGYVNE